MLGFGANFVEKCQLIFFYVFFLRPLACVAGPWCGRAPDWAVRCDRPRRTCRKTDHSKSKKMRKIGGGTSKNVQNSWKSMQLLKILGKKQGAEFLLFGVGFLLLLFLEGHLHLEGFHHLETVFSQISMKFLPKTQRFVKISVQKQ